MASILVNTDGTGTAMKDILPLVRARVGLSQNQTTQDDQLAYLAEVAMGKYSELAPRIERTTIATVAQQLTYALPNDCRAVYDVYLPQQVGYFNDAIFLPMLDSPTSSLFGMSQYAYRSPSERLVRDGILQELDHYVQAFLGYTVEMGTPPMLYLLPLTQTSGLNVIVRYGADHPNSSSDPTNPSWNTLPPGHWRHIPTLILWALAQQRADLITSSMSMSGASGGSQAMTQSWQLLNRAERALHDVQMALGAEVTVGMRS